MKKDLLFNQLKSALYDIEEMYETHNITYVALEAEPEIMTGKQIEVTLRVNFEPIEEQDEEEEEEEPPTPQIDYSEVNKGDGLKNLRSESLLKEISETVKQAIEERKANQAKENKSQVFLNGKPVHIDPNSLDSQYFVKYNPSNYTYITPPYTTKDVAELILGKKGDKKGE